MTLGDFGFVLLCWSMVWLVICGITFVVERRR
jgi:hypothetical protein